MGDLTIEEILVGLKRIDDMLVAHPEMFNPYELGGITGLASAIQGTCLAIMNSRTYDPGWRK